MKNRLVAAFSALFLITLGVACAPPQAAEDPAAVRAAIEAANAKFAEAYNNGDTATVGAMYTEDAIALPPGATMAKGPAAIQEVMAGDIKLGATGLTLTTQDLEVAGNLAIEVGAYTIQIGPFQDQGKYLVVWKKQQDGAWKLHRDMWNSNLPPPEPPEEEDEEAQ